MPHDFSKMARLLTQIGYFQKPQAAPQFIQPPAPSYRPYAKGREYQPFHADDVRGRYTDPFNLQMLMMQGSPPRGRA